MARLRSNLVLKFNVHMRMLHRVIALKLSAVLHGASTVMHVASITTRLSRFLRRVLETTAQIFYAQILQKLSGVCWASTTGVKVTGICAKPGPVRTEPGVGVCVCDCVC